MALACHVFFQNAHFLCSGGNNRHLILRLKTRFWDKTILNLNSFGLRSDVIVDQLTVFKKQAFVVMVTKVTMAVKESIT